MILSVRRVKSMESMSRNTSVKELIMFITARSNHGRETTIMISMESSEEVEVVHHKTGSVKLKKLQPRLSLMLLN